MIGRSTGIGNYTDIIELGANDYLYIYDRIPCGWSAIPDDSSLTNSVWVVRIRVAGA